MPVQHPGHFGSQKNLLTYRPNIKYIEPNKIAEQRVTVSKQTVSPAQETIEQINSIVDEYTQVEQAADDLQEKINSVCSNMTMKLDPTVDNAVLDAMERFFGIRTDQITFEQYQICLKTLNESADTSGVVLTQENIEVATTNPYKTDFGSLGNIPGLARPEIDTANQIVKPLDLKKFQQDSLLSLFNMMKPKITDLIKDVVGM